SEQRASGTRSKNESCRMFPVKRVFLPFVLIVCGYAVAVTAGAQSIHEQSPAVLRPQVGRMDAAVLRSPKEMDVLLKTPVLNDAVPFVDRPEPTIPREQDRAAKEAANSAAAAHRLSTRMFYSPATEFVTSAAATTATVGPLEGLNFEPTRQDEVTNGWSPSDAHGAVGINQFVEVTNSHISIYDKVPQSGTSSPTRLVSRE